MPIKARRKRLRSSAYCVNLGSHGSNMNNLIDQFFCTSVDLSC